MAQRFVINFELYICLLDVWVLFRFVLKFKFRDVIIVDSSINLVNNLEVLNYFLRYDFLSSSCFRDPFFSFDWLSLKTFLSDDWDEV